MRKPKWTYDEMIRHFVWRITDRNIHIESAEDRDEYQFCENFYAKDPDVLRHEAARHLEAERQTREMDSECRRIASNVIASGEDRVLEVVLDRHQKSRVKMYVLLSHQYGRQVIDRVLNSEEDWLKWLVFDHPHVKAGDLTRVATDPTCTFFIQDQAQRALSRRFNRDVPASTPQLLS